MECLEQRIAPAVLLTAGQLANHRDAHNLLATDAQGNVFTAGVFTGTIDVDLGPGVHNLTTPNAAGDLYIAKYDSSGSLLWAQTWIGSDIEKPRAILVDGNGDLFVTGEFGGSASFGGGVGGPLTATGGVDAFVLKLNGADGSPNTAFDGDGQMTWGGTFNEFPLALTFDLAGNLLVGGTFDSTNAGFNGTGPLNANGITGFLFRVNATSGAPDSTFDGDGMFVLPTTDQSVARVVVDGNNDLFLGIEDFGASTHQVRKLNGFDGSVALSFANIGVLSLGSGVSIAEGNFGVLIDSNGHLLVAETRPALSPSPAILTISAYNTAVGTPISTFASGGSTQVTGLDTHNFTFTRDSNGNLYLGGTLEDGKYFLQQVSRDGLVLQGAQFFGEPHDVADAPNDLGVAIDASDHLIVRGTYSLATTDLDPTSGILKKAPRASAVSSADMKEGFIVSFDPYGFDQKHPLEIMDGRGETVRVTLTGPGRGHYSLANGDLDFADLNTLELFDTDLKSALAITHQTNFSQITSVAKIFTHGTNQHVGSITLGSHVSLGDFSGDITAEIRVTGKLNALTIDTVTANSLIKLGEGLPYNVTGDTTTPDTYNNRPNLTIGAVFGANVTIDVTGDGSAGGVGGGGLGKVVIGSWSSPGLIKTTQSVGDFTVKTGDFYGTLEIDKFHVGEATQADVGTMTIAGGAWGGSGTEIEGDVKAFNAEAFLAGASITAASIGTVTTTSGDFEGTLILTDPDAAAVPTFTVSSDFTGTVISANSIKKLNIKGDFTGSLEAPSIGAITAYAFIGTPGVTYIKTTAGPLGLLTATAGVVRDYQIITDYAFSGFNVKLAKIDADVAGIDNVRVTAASIGNITVSLAAGAKTSDVDLVGIRNSQFTTTATGATKTTMGKLGNVTVTLAGAVAGSSAIGIQNSSFDAQVLVGEFAPTAAASTVNPLGNVTVKVTGSGGASLGLDHASFSGDTIGATKVSVSRKGTSAIARGVETADFTATGAIGAFAVEGDATSTQVTALKVWAGGKVGNVSVKATTAANGSLVDSAILAGQSLALSGATAKDLLAELAKATLGSVNVSGSIANSDLIAGGSISAVTTGGAFSDVLVVAGARLGGDFDFDGDEAYQRAASIAAVTVKGTYARSSLIAGVDPGNGVFGDADDSLAPTAGVLTQSSSLGPLSFSVGPTLVAADGSAHNYAIQAAVIKGLKVGTTPATAGIPSPLVLDAATPGEDADDLLVRVIS